MGGGHRRAPRCPMGKPAGTPKSPCDVAGEQFHSAIASVRRACRVTENHVRHLTQTKYMNRTELFAEVKSWLEAGKISFVSDDENLFRFRLNADNGLFDVRM